MQKITDGKAFLLSFYFGLQWEFSPKYFSPFFKMSPHLTLNLDECMAVKTRKNVENFNAFLP